MVDDDDVVCHFRDIVGGSEETRGACGIIDEVGTAALAAFQKFERETWTMEMNKSAESVEPSSKGTAVLVVDDDQVVLESCQAILSGPGYDVETAQRGDEALEMVEKKCFEVVLIDLKMPGMPGMALLERIRELSPETINIIITGFATVETAVEAMKMGAFDYVCKPFGPDELEIVVRRALDNKALREAAEQAERESEQFILRVYHQLKSPVGIIQGYIDNLLRGAPSQEEERNVILQRCLRRAQALGQSLEDLLSLSRMKTGRLKPNLEWVSLHNALQRAVEGWDARAGDRNIELGLNLARDLPSIWADRTQIEHMFANLVDNALRYNRADGKVEIKTSLNRGEVRIDVADTGVGIEARDLPRIFDEFYRCQNEETRMNRGSGLGLSIVREIVAAHGGRIDVQSVVGQGTTFSIWLPLCEK